jgi:phosphatidylserine/phosphatidylglycerophosphate/cardiolipin synthase-like enzyme
MAAYVLTDWAVMQALTRAADRGVQIRVYLDGAQFAEREPAKVFRDLAETPGVEIRIKRDTGAPMPSRAMKSTGDCCAPAPRTFPRPASSARIMI